MSSDGDSGLTRFLRSMRKSFQKPEEAPVPASQLLERYRTPGKPFPAVTPTAPAAPATKAPAPQDPAPEYEPSADLVQPMARPYPTHVQTILTEFERRGSPVANFQIYGCNDVGLTADGLEVRFSFCQGPESPMYHLRVVLNRGKVVRIKPE